MREHEAEKIYAAIHEGGHALVAYLSGFARKESRIWTDEEGRWHGVLEHHDAGACLMPHVYADESYVDDHMLEDLRRLHRVDIAGSVAEYLAYRGGVGEIARWREAEEKGSMFAPLLAEMFSRSEGLADNWLKDPEHYLVEFGPQRLIRPTAEMLADHWGAVRDVADTLCAQGWLSGEDIVWLVERSEAAAFARR